MLLLNWKKEEMSDSTNRLWGERNHWKLQKIKNNGMLATLKEQMKAWKTSRMPPISAFQLSEFSETPQFFCCDNTLKKFLQWRMLLCTRCHILSFMFNFTPHTCLGKNNHSHKLSQLRHITAVNSPSKLLSYSILYSNCTVDFMETFLSILIISMRGASESFSCSRWSNPLKKMPETSVAPLQTVCSLSVSLFL